MVGRYRSGAFMVAGGGGADGTAGDASCSWLEKLAVDRMLASSFRREMR